MMGVRVCAIVAACMLSTGAQAQQRVFVIPAGPLDQALSALGRQAGIDIGSAEPGLAALRSAAFRTDRPVRAALDRLLRDTPYVAVAVGGGSFRIVRRGPVSASRPPRRTAPSPGPVTGDEVVVVASKSATPLLRFPGSVLVLGHESAPGLGQRAGAGFSELAATVPIMQSTALGPGRDKLFVRGVADSSFLGPTQSTATVYFGDVQLGYNGPDPNLNLYDVDRIEILEGPQGTLYGAGSIGGTVRISPREPDLRTFAAHVSAGGAMTQHGAPSADLAAMVNLPIVADRLGVRAVAYDKRDGGYIDDSRRGLANVNRVRTTGGRVAARLAGPDWSVEAGGVVQFISARDSQYAERAAAPLTRQSALAQPFEQDYLLGRLVVEKRWDSGLQLLSASGFVSHEADDRFDASGRQTSLRAYDTHNRGRLYTQEVRLFRRGPAGSWLVGISGLRANDSYTRTIGPLNAPRDIVGVANRATITAVFGEATLPVTSALSLTAGGRFSHARIDGEPVASSRVNQFLQGRASNRFDPTAALSWAAVPGWAVFARYQSGFRTGGIAVAPGVGRVANFDADAIHVAELGVRKVRRGTRGVAGAISLSYADWDRVQADLVSRTGAPFTANIGTARIKGVEFTGNWLPDAHWRLEAALFVNDARVIRPAPGQSEGRLPDTPAVSFDVRLNHLWTLRSRDHGEVYADWRRVGSSLLGTASPLNLPQGGYQVVNLGANWSHRRYVFGATWENALNTRGNRFASGNPVGLGSIQQYTPLRPRTFRFGIAVPIGADHTTQGERELD